MTRRDWNLIIGECEEFRRQTIYTVGREKKPSNGTKRGNRKSRPAQGPCGEIAVRIAVFGPFVGVCRACVVRTIVVYAFSTYPRFLCSFAVSPRTKHTYPGKSGRPTVPFCAPIFKRSVYFSEYVVKSSKTLRGKNIKSFRTRLNRTVHRKTYRDTRFKYSLYRLDAKKIPLDSSKSCFDRFPRYSTPSLYRPTQWRCDYLLGDLPVRVCAFNRLSVCFSWCTRFRMGCINKNQLPLKIIARKRFDRFFFIMFVHVRVKFLRKKIFGEIGNSLQFCYVNCLKIFPSFSSVRAYLENYSTEFSTAFTNGLAGSRERF